MQGAKVVAQHSTSLPSVAAASQTVHVIGTSLEATREALVAATALARGLAGRVALFLCRPSPIRRLSDEAQRAENDIKRLAESFTPPPNVLSCVCDRPIDVAQLFLSPGIVVIGGAARLWWPTPEQRLARALAKFGCHVTFVHVPRVQFVSPLVAVARGQALQASKSEEAPGRTR